MPVTSSAIKKDRQDKKARQRNRALRDDFKIASKNFRKLILAGNIKEAAEALKVAYSKIDRAAKKNILHKNNANRKKSKLAKRFLGANKETPKK